MGDSQDVVHRILFEDNHLIGVNKYPSELVQGDNTGDQPLADRVREYLKEKYGKQGNVFLGIPHRLDRPSSGVVLFARTDKALSRMNAMLKERKIKKTYWVVLDNPPPNVEGELRHFLRRDSSKNKSFAVTKEKNGVKEAVLHYQLVAATNTYFLVEVELVTGRHHQIRAQFAAEGCHVKGDVKYGARRSNRGGGIHLHARRIAFNHPVRQQRTVIEAPPPKDPLWDVFSSMVHQRS